MRLNRAILASAFAALAGLVSTRAVEPGSAVVEPIAKEEDPWVPVGMARPSTLAPLYCGRERS